MADKTSSTMTIEAAPSVIMGVIADFPAYPAWATGVRAAEVMRARQDGLADRVRFTLDVELSGIIEGRQLTMRARGKAPGSTVDVVSALRLEDAGADRTRLDWAATSDLNGTVASVGGRLLEGTARRLTEGFWTDFARRVSAG